MPALIQDPRQSFLGRSRTREIGVRVAIGATPRAVVAMVVREAMIWTVTGMAIGLALAVLAAGCSVQYSTASARRIR